MALRTLMKPETFDELQDIRQSLRRGLSESPPISHSFVPVCGISDATLPRFFIVGQATRGWGDPEDLTYDFQASASDAFKVFSENLVTDRGPFWTFARKFVARTVDRLGYSHGKETLQSFMGWSNLAKIGVKDGNPSGDLLRKQAPICIQHLRYELSQYQPDVVLLTTGLFAHKEILDEVFGAVWHRHGESEHVEYTTIEGIRNADLLVIWTNHPRVLGCAHDPLLEIITNMAAKAFRGRS